MKKKNEISEEKLDTIKKEIKKTKTKKMSENQKQARRKAMANLVFLFFIIVYYVLNLMGSATLAPLTFVNDLKSFTIFQLVIAIILIEKAFKSNSRTFASLACELIVNAGMTLVLNNVYLMHYNMLHWYISGFIGAFTLYFIIKSIVIVKINK